MAKLEIWANMPVKNVEKTRNFFKQLGFRPFGDQENKDLASFIFSDDHFVIHFFQEHKFEEGTKIKVVDTSTGSEIMFSIGAKSKEEVDQWQDKIIQAGGTIFFGPAEMAGGYNLAFEDLDGHRWNVFYWPPQ